MAHPTEKRSKDRWPSKAEVIYSKFHSGDAETTFCCNFNDVGLCIRTDAPIPTGTPIYVRLRKGYACAQTQSGQECPRSVGLAEVRWCRKVESGGGVVYQVGLKYLHPAY